MLVPEVGSACLTKADTGGYNNENNSGSPATESKMHEHPDRYALAIAHPRFAPGTRGVDCYED